MTFSEGDLVTRKGEPRKVRIVTQVSSTNAFMRLDNDQLVNPDNFELLAKKDKGQ